jgi:2OG-Fe(II) oxygenase superfamily
MLRGSVKHPNASYLDDNICVINNFLSVQDHEALLFAASSATQEDWEAYQIVPKWFGKVLSYKIDQSILDSIMSLLPFKYDYDGLNLLRRVPEGDVLEEHYDSKAKVNVAYGFILYLNDNYDGGELYYPNKGIEYKPVKNTLVIHPSTEEYTHGVKAVSSGTRYFMTMFADYKL